MVETLNEDDKVERKPKLAAAIATMTTLGMLDHTSAETKATLNEFLTHNEEERKSHKAKLAIISSTRDANGKQVIQTTNDGDRVINVDFDHTHIRLTDERERLIASYDVILRGDHRYATYHFTRFHNKYRDKGVRGHARYADITNLIRAYFSKTYPDINFDITRASNDGSVRFYVLVEFCRKDEVYKTPPSHALKVHSFLQAINHIDLYSDEVKNVVGYNLSSK